MGEDGRREPGLERERMSVNVALDLGVCGALLGCLSVAANYLDPEFVGATLVTGLVGGGLCVLWAVLGRRGTPCRGAAMATLGTAACIFVGQAVQSWKASGDDQPNGRMGVAMMGVLVVCCASMLLLLLREGTEPPT